MFGDGRGISHRDLVETTVSGDLHPTVKKRLSEVVGLLRQAGFAETVVDRDLRRIHRAQSRHMPLLKGLERAAQHRYAIAAAKG